MHEFNRDGAFTHGGGDALDRAVTHIAGHENVSITRERNCTAICGVFAIWSIKYCDMVSASESPHTLISSAQHPQSHIHCACFPPIPLKRSFISWANAISLIMILTGILQLRWRIMKLMNSLKGLALTGSTYANVNDFRAVLITTD